MPKQFLLLQQLWTLILHKFSYANSGTKSLTHLRGLGLCTGLTIHQILSYFYGIHRHQSPQEYSQE